VHVGDLSTVTEQVFVAWQHDRSTGLDSIMLAPTRELVGQLNQRARTIGWPTPKPTAMRKWRWLTAIGQVMAS
jgi:superfamily II DNA/RNA helicase